jgi:hypothetical protein
MNYIQCELSDCNGLNTTYFSFALSSHTDRLRVLRELISYGYGELPLIAYSPASARNIVLQFEGTDHDLILFRFNCPELQIVKFDINSKTVIGVTSVQDTYAKIRCYV